MSSSLSVNTSGSGVGSQMALVDLCEGSTGPHQGHGLPKVGRHKCQSRVYSLYSTDIQDTFTPVMVRNPDGSISALPNCLQSLVGSTQTRLLDSCTYYDHGPFESFNCKDVLLDEDGCESVGSSTPPSLPNKEKGVLPIPTPVKQVEAIVRPTYADSNSEDTNDADPHERQSTDDRIGEDSGLR